MSESAVGWEADAGPIGVGCESDMRTGLAVN
jgi:hypothetical protein